MCHLFAMIKKMQHFEHDQQYRDVIQQREIKNIQQVLSIETLKLLVTYFTVEYFLYMCTILFELHVNPHSNDLISNHSQSSSSDTFSCDDMSQRPWLQGNLHW